MVSSLMPKPKKPDDSALKLQEKRIADEEKRLADERKQKAMQQTTGRSRGGRSSLLSGSETGVKRTTLG